MVSSAELGFHHAPSLKNPVNSPIEATSQGDPRGSTESRGYPAIGIYQPRMSDDEKTEARALFQKGLNPHKIGKYMGIHPQSIHRTVEDLKQLVTPVVRPEPSPRIEGETNPEYIKRLLREKHSGYQISKFTGIHPQTIARIKRKIETTPPQQ